MAFVAATAGRGAASKGAASRGAARRKPAAAGGRTKAEQQREAIQAIKDARPPTAETPAETPAEPSTTSQGSARPVFRLEPPDAVGAGSGAVLGVLAWVVAVNYIKGGVPQVKQLLRAKFLNKTE